MLTNTFCHIPGIGQIRERKLWDAGLHCWDTALENGQRHPQLLSHFALQTLHESKVRLDNNDATWFARKLPKTETWRLCSHFHNCAAFVDIETTSGPGPVQITTIALFDGNRLCTYVNGRNLEDFCDDILGYPMLVTFNGRCFDGPVIERQLRVTLPAAHVDLRFMLRSIGYQGGLKACEKQLGLYREELEGLDGYFAVLLWHEYQATGDERVLETLLAYNTADVLSMPVLLNHAYETKLRNTPFYPCPLPSPKIPQTPYRAHKDVIHRIRKRFGIRFLPEGR
jgi:uncharacterized protein